MGNFNRKENQVLLDETFGIGVVIAGDGRGESALAVATQEQRDAYIIKRRLYNRMENYFCGANRGQQPWGKA